MPNLQPIANEVLMEIDSMPGLQPSTGEISNDGDLFDEHEFEAMLQQAGDEIADFANHHQSDKTFDATGVNVDQLDKMFDVVENESKSTGL